VADTDLWVSGFTAAVVLSIIVLFFRHFQIATFDPIMAASIGLPVLLLDYVLTTCVSLVVVSAVSMVGVILVVGLLITPAATAYLLSDRLDKMMWLAGLFGLTSVVGGLYLCVWLDSAGGGAIMLFCTLQFLVVLAIAPKYGLLARWLRLKRLVPQQTVEDVLTTILRYDGVTSIADIKKYVNEQPKKLKRALQRMIQDDLLLESAEGFSLTKNGRIEADKVLRAHRLWEAYLAQIGTPKDALHPKAHQLEHIREGGAVDYLDEKLGNPGKDPHGQVIS
jgi:manganese/iron transport system permease protein/iron/zinc/copper transport system permease protein